MYHLGGVHLPRTIMLDELIILFSQVGADAPPAAYRAAVREHNCLGKRSGRTRQLTARHLAELNGLNIRPFVTAPDVKKKGASVLVYKPNIHWKKDSGKDLESAPRYNLGPG